MKGELYEYNGQMLSQASIAKLEGINRSTLADWYKKTGNMKLAVEGAKKSLAQRNISYNGEILSLKAIAEREKIKFESLKRNYEQTNDIYKAVELTKESQLKRNGSIEYNGKMMTILAISKEEELDYHSLGRYYEKTKDINEAVRLTREAKLKQNGTIEYNGKKMTISAIASLERIKKETLKKYYELYNDIYKAVFITKQSQLKRKKALLRGKKATYDELSKQFGISVLELDKYIESGVTPDEIIKKQKRGVKKEDQILLDDESLYRYCLDHSYNYWTILYLIKVYGKTPEEAITEYEKNGQKIPTKWIYEKYNLLFKHLALNFGLDSNKIIKIVKDNNCSIEEAIQKLVFITNNSNNDFDKAEIDWMEELYYLIKDLTQDEYNSAKKTFFITEREEKYLKEKSSKIELINRYLLLYELANVIEEWSIDELLEIMDLYDITNEEKIIMILDLYSPFSSMIINPTKEYNERQLVIRNYIINSLYSNHDIKSNIYLTEEEKKEIIKKRDILSKIFKDEKTKKEHK